MHSVSMSINRLGHDAFISVCLSGDECACRDAVVTRVRLVRGRAVGGLPAVANGRVVAAAAALRSRGLGVVRGWRARRPSILGRDGFFTRYGDRERAAVADFDFLDDLSGGSSPDATKDCT